MDHARFAELDQLPTDDLRERAFAIAEHRHDVHFFWDLFRHVESTGAIAIEDGSFGNITGSVAATVEAAREVLGKDPDPADEPLLRARFIDYVMAHS